METTVGREQEHESARPRIGLGTATWAAAVAGAALIVGAFVAGASDITYGFVIFAVAFGVGVVAAAGRRGGSGELGRTAIEVVSGLALTVAFTVALLVLAGMVGLA